MLQTVPGDFPSKPDAQIAPTLVVEFVFSESLFTSTFYSASVFPALRLANFVVHTFFLFFLSRGVYAVELILWSRDTSESELLDRVARH